MSKSLKAKHAKILTLQIGTSFPSQALFLLRSGNLILVISKSPTPTTQSQESPSVLVFSLSLFLKNIYLFICLFGCATSLLRHVGPF